MRESGLDEEAVVQFAVSKKPTSSGVESDIIELTFNTGKFVRTLCIFADSLRRLNWSEQLTTSFQQEVSQVLAAELRHYERCLTSEQFVSKVNNI